MELVWIFSFIIVFVVLVRIVQFVVKMGRTQKLRREEINFLSRLTQTLKARVTPELFPRNADGFLEYKIRLLLQVYVDQHLINLAEPANRWFCREQMLLKHEGTYAGKTGKQLLEELSVIQGTVKTLKEGFWKDWGIAKRLGFDVHEKIGQYVHSETPVIE